MTSKPGDAHQKETEETCPLIREIEAGDELIINNEFNRVFGQSRSLREWNWKFGERGSRSKILIAVDHEGEILAHYAAVKIPIYYLGQTLNAGHIVDIFSRRNPAVVQHRTFLKLQQEFHHRFGNSGEMPLQFGFPGIRAERLINVTGVCKNGRPLSVWNDGGASIPFSRDLRGWKAGEDFKVGEIDRLWDIAKSRHRFSAIRDERWLRDRYTAHPRNQYRIFVVRRASLFGKKEIEAWGVFLKQKDKILWVDLEWNGDDEVALDVLWREAMRHLRADKKEPNLEIWLQGDSKVESWLENRNWSQRLWADGPRISFIVFDPLDLSMPRNEQFRLTAGDTDIA